MRRRRLFLDTDTQSNAPTPRETPVQKLALATTSMHREGLRTAAAHPSKTHVAGDTMYIAGGFRRRNEEGLRRAYAAPDKTYVDGDTEFIAGTDPTDYRDLLADVMIPFNMTRYGHRYSQAEKTLKENPQVTRLVGHSLGQATAAALQKQYYGDRDLKVVGYGSPEIKMSIAPTPDTVRMRHGGDPISALDGESLTIGASADPFVAHGYTGYTEELPENAPENLEENTAQE